MEAQKHIRISPAKFGGPRFATAICSTCGKRRQIVQYGGRYLLRCGNCRTNDDLGAEIAACECEACVRGAIK